MEQYEPLHADRHRSSFNLSLILSLGVVVIGLFTFTSTSEPFILIIGLGLAAFSWLTTPSQYMLFNDRLIIAYGRPRIRHVLFQQVDQVEVLKLPIGDRLLVRLRNGRRLIIQPRDAEGFQSRFQGALESFHSGHAPQQPEDESQQPPDPADDQPDPDTWKPRE